MSKTKMKTKEQVHVCPICDTAHFNEWEHMRVCIKCYREHELDLGFMEFLMDNADHVQEAVQVSMNKSFEGMDKQARELHMKWEKQSRRSKLLIKFYVLAMLYWLGVTWGQIIW